jgi:hypothetical protein
MRPCISTTFGAFSTVIFQVEFWFVTQRSVVVGYQRFRGPCCLYLQGEDNFRSLSSSFISRNQLPIIGDDTNRSE